MELLPAQMELDLAYSSEKVLNLELLTMQLADKVGDFEAIISGSEEHSGESAAVFFQFDILSGFLNSEVREIESFISKLQFHFINSREKIPENGFQFDAPSPKIHTKLHYAEESLRNSQEHVADIRKQSESFEKLLAFGDFSDNLENDQSSKLNLQAAEQHRYFLQSFEKSLAREMDLETKLSKSIYAQKELKVKLHFAEQNAYNCEDWIEAMMEKTFAAENCADILLGKSNELIEKMRKLEKFNNFKEVESSDLNDRTNLLEEKLRESDTKLQSAIDFSKKSEEQQNIVRTVANNTETVIENLKEAVIELKNRAESAEVRCAQLTKANADLDGELDFLRTIKDDKIELERKLKESDSQLEHSKASVDAFEEHQSMLYTALNDMSVLIRDLKGKVLKEESRADSAEAKCILLVDTNSELNEELGFLRGRLESMEASLNQSSVTKMAVSKEIENRVKLIADLVKKLTSERDFLQLQVQISAFRRSLMPTEKHLRSVNGDSVDCSKKTNNSVDETHVELSASSQADESEMKAGPAASEEYVSNEPSIQAARPDRKYILTVLERQEARLFQQA